MSNLVKIVADGGFRTKGATDITVATTIDVADSGTCYRVAIAAADYNIILPAPTVAGLQYRFIVSANAGTNAVTLRLGANLARGIISLSAGAATANAANGYIIFGTTSIAGSLVDVYSDGTNWHVLAHGTVGITAT